jgi:hypothetical protein
MDSDDFDEREQATRDLQIILSNNPSQFRRFLDLAEHKEFSTEQQQRFSGFVLKMLAAKSPNSESFEMAEHEENQKEEYKAISAELHQLWRSGTEKALKTLDSYIIEKDVPTEVQLNGCHLLRVAVQRCYVFTTPEGRDKLEGWIEKTAAGAKYDFVRQAMLELAAQLNPDLAKKILTARK